jgi:glutamate/aspartate transport system substrate-binding protein
MNAPRCRVGLGAIADVTVPYLCPIAGRGGRVVRPCLLAAVLLVLGLVQPAAAQEQESPANRLSGTLAKVRSSGVVTIGYRAASFPFSYLDAANNPIGYSIDLCKAIVGEIARAVDKPQLRTQFELVTPETRIPALASGKVDLVCGSASDTVERRKLVAFSPTTFVTGTKLMVKRSSGIKSIAGLKGKVVVATAGTTGEQAVIAINDKQKLGIHIVSAPDHEQAYGMVADGKADAFANDDVLLYGMIVRHAAQREFIVVGDYLSYDPYGIMFRRDDPQLKDAVDATFHELADSRDLLEIYHKWFVRRTPTGERLNLPISTRLAEVFRILGATD